MASCGVTWVVRQSFNKFIHPQRSSLLLRSLQKPVTPVLQSWCPCAAYSTSLTEILERDNANVTYKNGMTVFSVPLPSRVEMCEFVLKPVTNTVKDLFLYMKEEDPGIEQLGVYREGNGVKIAGCTPIGQLVQTPFFLKINGSRVRISVPEESSSPMEKVDLMADVKSITAQLYNQLNVLDHQINKEERAIASLEEYKQQIAPLQMVKEQIEHELVQRNKTFMYLGSSLMGFQFGFFARLTWVEYSWDVMEPVTYFATYFAVISMYAYFTVCSMEYNYVDAWDREFLRKFHKKALAKKFDVNEYNRLTNLISECESDLRRLRDPLQKHLPIREL